MLRSSDGVRSFGIRSIIEDKDGKFWICNTRYRFKVSPKNLPTNGLLNYKSEPGIKAYSEDKDLIYFQSVIRGKEGDLWMMPWGGGVFRYDGKRVAHYSVKTGDKDAYMSSIYRDRKGDLWICSQTGGPYKFDGKRFVPFVP